jgi:hypothetical protein
MNRISRDWKRIVVVALVALAVAAAAAWYLRGRNSPPIAATGGQSFTNFAAIQTPFYLQRDARWKDETIGSGETLGKVGCTVSSLAMALDRYGVSFTPKSLNDALKANDGYTRRGWLQWIAVTKVSEGKAQVAVLSAPTHGDMDAALQAGEPILAKVFINRVIPHWVLVVGKDGQEYLMRDPLNERKDLEHLSKYGSDVYGVRIVKAANGKAKG